MITDVNLHSKHTTVRNFIFKHCHGLDVSDSCVSFNFGFLVTVWTWTSGISKNILENKTKTKKKVGKIRTQIYRFTRELYWPFYKRDTWTVAEKTCSNHVWSVQVFRKQRNAVIKTRAVHECTEETKNCSNETSRITQVY